MSFCAVFFIKEVPIMRNTKIRALCECAIMIALAFVLSCVRLYKMPLGGSVTLASMLPIMLIAIKHGPKIGLGTAFVYSLTQLIQAYTEGDVFPYCETAATLVICMLFDYVVPFTALGLAGTLKNVRLFRHRQVGAYVGMVGVVMLRFASHFITGVAIWGQWAPEGMGKYIYSLAYNGSFLAVDLAICLVCAVPMLCSRAIRRLINLD